MPLLQYQFLLKAVAEDDGADSCREWPFTRDKYGYGQLKIEKGSRISRKAHVAAYAIAHGLSVPLPFVVRHTCDNPPCFRIRHLLSGSQADNLRDAIERGRLRMKGADHPLVKLTETQVLAIRDLYPKMEGTKNSRCTVIGKLLNVSIGCIQGIVEGNRWKHLRPRSSDI